VSSPSPNPYLLRAYWEWMEDAGHTPHILVNCTHNSVQLPKPYSEQDKVLLNIASSATSALILGDEHVQFKARFDGKSHDVYVPIEAIESIYAIENGIGMMFNHPDKTKKKEDHLRIVD
jgi:stringent starvation protein B